MIINLGELTATEATQLYYGLFPSSADPEFFRYFTDSGQFTPLEDILVELDWDALSTAIEEGESPLPFDAEEVLGNPYVRRYSIDTSGLQSCDLKELQEHLDDSGRVNAEELITGWDVDGPALLLAWRDHRNTPVAVTPSGMVDDQQLRKALHEFNVLGRRRNMFGTLMLDRDTGDVWTDEFIDDHSWINYDDPAVVNLESEMRDAGYLPVFIDSESDTAMTVTNVWEFAEQMCKDYLGTTETA